MSKLLFLSVCLVALLVVVDSAIRIPIKRKISEETLEAISKATVPRGSDFQSSTVVPLGGTIGSIGEFYVSVTLGTPPQNFDLQIDTGSSDLLVDSIGCDGCGNATKFDAAASSTFHTVSCTTNQFTCPMCYNTSFCGFNDVYGDGSHAGGEVTTDVFSVGSLTANISFGLIENSSAGFEPSGVDGIWGLAFPSLSDWLGTPPFFEFVEQDSIYPAFSMCLNLTGGGGGGVMDFGVNYQGDSGFNWTNIITDLYYVVEINELAVAGQSVATSGFGQSIVDSGTTLLYLTSSVYSAFASSVQNSSACSNLGSVCSALFGGACSPLTESEISSFPTLSFTLQGTGALNVPPQSYLYYSPQNESYCLGIMNGGAGNNNTILGDIFIQNFHTVFDNSTQTVGFGPLSSCPSAF